MSRYLRRTTGKFTRTVQRHDGDRCATCFQSIICAYTVSTLGIHSAQAVLWWRRRATVDWVPHRVACRDSRAALGELMVVAVELVRHGREGKKGGRGGEGGRGGRGRGERKGRRESVVEESPPAERLSGIPPLRAFASRALIWWTLSCAGWCGPSSPELSLGCCPHTRLQRARGRPHRL